MPVGVVGGGEAEPKVRRQLQCVTRSRHVLRSNERRLSNSPELRVRGRMLQSSGGEGATPSRRRHAAYPGPGSTTRKRYRNTQRAQLELAGEDLLDQLGGSGGRLLWVDRRATVKRGISRGWCLESGVAVDPDRWK